MKIKNFGMNVEIKLGKRYQNAIVKVNNVTEIHYIYPSVLREKRVAFESDIHGSGLTYPLKDVKEFEAIIALKIENTF